MKILALVKFNSSVAMVLDEMPDLKFKKQGEFPFEHVILGSDGTFLQTYFYDQPGTHWQAFGGRKFDIMMEDGSVEHCYGQWWDGVKETHKKMVDGEIVAVTAASIDDLKKCYVFFGYKGIKHKISELLSQYKGIIYDYWDYEMLVTNNRYRRSKKKLRIALRKIRCETRQLRKQSSLFKTTHSNNK
jgi:hypothetical protein